MAQFTLIWSSCCCRGGGGGGSGIDATSSSSNNGSMVRIIVVVVAVVAPAVVAGVTVLVAYSFAPSIYISTHIRRSGSSCGGGCIIILPTYASYLRHPSTYPGKIIYVGFGSMKLEDVDNANGTSNRMETVIG